MIHEDFFMILRRMAETKTTSRENINGIFKILEVDCSI